MANIYSSNKEFNGISASVNFVNGVGVTYNPHLISWFIEQGYTVEEEKREPSDYDKMNYKDLIALAQERGFNAIGVKKEQLIVELIELDKNGTTGLCKSTETEE